MSTASPSALPMTLAAPTYQPPAYQPPAYYPPPPPYAYAYSPPSYGRPAAPTNGLAVAALALGIIGIPTCTLFVGPILALIFGAVGKARIKRTGGRQAGKGMAVAGLILGGAGIVLAMVVYGLIITMAAHTVPTNGGLA
ncbi:MAG TPA: DUF4190 domain-containing protein [Actinomycetota bacterium]|nr:DUF4190 domain-containing protein [Actinomycetota bacterium]